MSGTSMDGIDATIIETNGITFKRTGYNYSIKYKPLTLKLLKQAIKKPLEFIKKKHSYNKLNYLVTIEHANVVNNLVTMFLPCNKEKPAVIGFHGQTIYHNPKEKLSIQIGNPRLLAELAKVNVIFDLRKNDIRQGGVGAPLAPIYHLSMIKELKQELPAAILNLGGVGNITWYNGNDLIGFDIGPGNGLMDIFIQKKIGSPFDMNGDLARKGTPSIKVVNDFLTHDFFKTPYPKSLDRLTFNSVLFQKDFLKLNINDALSTLAHLTIQSLKKSMSLLPKLPLSLIIVGGGQHNSYLVDNLKKTFNFSIFTADEIGLSGNMIEAELMAFLAVRSLKDLPITFPKTTGVKEPTNGGCLYKY